MGMRKGRDKPWQEEDVPHLTIRTRQKGGTHFSRVGKKGVSTFLHMRPFNCPSRTAICSPSPRQGQFVPSLGWSKFALKSSSASGV
jgi:hypothetical protein